MKLQWKLRPRRLATGLSLVIAWCALWGELSLANLFTGALLAAVVLGSNLGTACRGGIRVGPLLRFCGVVLVDLVESTISVAASILSRSEAVDEAIIAVDVPPSARRHFLLLICAVTVTPGTAIVDADPDTGRLYLHLLHAADADKVRQHVTHLAELADRALPTRASKPPRTTDNAAIEVTS